MINNASGVQLWWDQYLPASVAEVHKSASQKLFDNSESPEDVAKEQQDALDEYFSENGGDASTQS
jgi:raffinose/stachyose/melibiose transport system substrate-binding protein